MTEETSDADKAALKQRRLKGIKAYNFKPGETGNPKGRPKGSISLVQMIKDRLELIGPDEKRIVAEHFIDNVIQDALDDKGDARKLIFHYVEGMPKQKMEVDVDKDTLSELTSFFRAMALTPKEETKPDDSTGQESV